MNMVGEFLPLINDVATGMEAADIDGNGAPILKDIYVNIAGVSRLMADVTYGVPGI